MAKIAICLVKSQGESELGFSERQQQVMEKTKSLVHSPDPLGWNNPQEKKLILDPTLGATSYKNFSVDRLEQEPEAGVMITRIFLEIIQYFIETGEVSLANSVWRSIRADSNPDSEPYGNMSKKRSFQMT